MGHYASEMMDSTQPDPDWPNKLKLRQEALREHAEHLWKLYEEYDRRGVYYKDREMMLCPICYCSIPALLRHVHVKTHEESQ